MKRVHVQKEFFEVFFIPVHLVRDVREAAVAPIQEVDVSRAVQSDTGLEHGASVLSIQPQAEHTGRSRGRRTHRRMRFHTSLLRR